MRTMAVSILLSELAFYLSTRVISLTGGRPYPGVGLKESLAAR
jgi:hypothetical protein